MRVRLQRQQPDREELIGRRIADHIALTLSHQRLAEEARRSDELRATTANLELLDELLATVTDTGTLSQAFDRSSAIARKVLAHDALTLPVLAEVPEGASASGVDGAVVRLVGAGEVLRTDPEAVAAASDPVGFAGLAELLGEPDVPVGANRDRERVRARPGVPLLDRRVWFAWGTPWRPIATTPTVPCARPPGVPPSTASLPTGRR